jgi:hypothetical protein
MEQHLLDASVVRRAGEEGEDDTAIDVDELNPKLRAAQGISMERVLHNVDGVPRVFEEAIIELRRGGRARELKIPRVRRVRRGRRRRRGAAAAARARLDWQGGAVRRVGVVDAGVWRHGGGGGRGRRSGRRSRSLLLGRHRSERNEPSEKSLEAFGTEATLLICLGGAAHFSWAEGVKQLGEALAIGDAGLPELTGAVQSPLLGLAARGFERGAETVLSLGVLGTAVAIVLSKGGEATALRGLGFEAASVALTGATSEVLLGFSKREDGGEKLRLIRHNERQRGVGRR